MNHYSSSPHPEDGINRKHCHQIMDHDPSFLKACTQEEGTQKKKYDGTWRKIIRKPETEPRGARTGGDRLKRERGESRENRHHHHLCSFISIKKEKNPEAERRRTNRGRQGRERDREIGGRKHKPEKIKTGRVTQGRTKKKQGKTEKVNEKETERSIGQPTHRHQLASSPVAPPPWTDGREGEQVSKRRETDRLKQRRKERKQTKNKKQRMNNQTPKTRDKNENWQRRESTGRKAESQGRSREQKQAQNSERATRQEGTEENSLPPRLRHRLRSCVQVSSSFSQFCKLSFICSCAKIILIKNSKRRGEIIASQRFLIILNIIIIIIIIYNNYYYNYNYIIIL